MAASTRHGRQPAPPTPRRPQPPLPRNPRARHTTVRRTKPERRGGLPWPLRIVFAAAVLALGVGVFVAGTGAFDGAAGRLGSALGGLVNGVLGAGIGPTPTPENLAPAPPSLRQPTNRYTNKPTLDVVGRLPTGIAGQPDALIRIYIDGELADQAAVPRTADFVVEDVQLPRGWCEISATIIDGEGRESPASKPIAVAFDDVVPPLDIAEPTDGQALNGETTVVRGTTQGAARITIRNERNGLTTHGDATKEGIFEVVVPLDKGRNGLTITTRDLAGNQQSTVISVIRGDGELTAKLTLSASRIALASLPAELTINVNVLDPDGVPVEGAQVTFTLSPPGLPTETFEALTSSSGDATWPDVTIPRDGTTAGGGFVTAAIVLPDGKVVEQTAAFTIH